MVQGRLGAGSLPGLACLLALRGHSCCEKGSPAPLSVDDLVLLACMHLAAANLVYVGGKGLWLRGCL